jgi:hypothetical protein
MATTINASASSGLITTADTSTILQLQTGGTTAVTVDASQNVGVGATSPSAKLTVTDSNGIPLRIGDVSSAPSSQTACYVGTGTSGLPNSTNGDLVLIPRTSTTSAITFWSGNGTATERARITSGGDLLVGKTASSNTDKGATIAPSGEVQVTITTAGGGSQCLFLNRQDTDGTLVLFRQANTTEGEITVSGTTVSYLGGHLSRYAQTATAKDESLVKGTVLSNLDEMNAYTDAEGNPVQNEQLNKVKVSDVEGDANVAGVFVNWTHDEDHNVDEINMAMTGDMIIRIAQGTTVQRGDLLMSAGDGTAKPQGDDIVRSKTVAKVTSTHVTCTYADGSFCVPCVLMAC